MAGGGRPFMDRDSPVSVDAQNAPALVLVCQGWPGWCIVGRRSGN
ncbi:hypothetical protein DF3PB_2090002 [uncultured Defluviicoccus sp.]|uniref:Uncharacterized protein n=1 Tax=metagenome TaxID=256318 RepID=A0A380TDM8_9ZZZZ|nr:hypothetical protein DF3PB_2090002 [uncultured Defluviicoccus sp.]